MSKSGVPREMTVQRVDRSPMNPYRWCLELSCGHEVWVTAKRKPTRMKAVCPECKEPRAPQPEGKEGLET